MRKTKIWTLTCLITPYYDLLGELRGWTISKGIKKSTAYRYVADMFDSLANAAGQMPEPDFAGFAHNAATPGGMNEAAGKEIRSKGAHETYKDSAESIHGRFKDDLSKK